jgi:hypothetical protein
MLNRRVLESLIDMWPEKEADAPTYSLSGSTVAPGSTVLYTRITRGQGQEPGRNQLHPAEF